MEKVPTRKIQKRKEKKKERSKKLNVLISQKLN